MPDPTTESRLRGLVLSANELRSLTNWPEALIEDYLNLVDNFITLAGIIDIEVDQKIEEIPTDFTDGSIPYVNSNLLVEDNTNLVWSAIFQILAVKALIVNDTTASLLLSTNGDKEVTSVADLTAWIAGTTNQVIVTDDGDGTLTLSLPQNIDTDADVEFDSIILDDLTALRLASSDASKKLVSIADFTTWITGSDLQTIIDDGDGTASHNDDNLEFYIQAVA